MEAVDTWIEYMRSFLSSPEARTLIVVHNLSCAGTALLMMASCFEISGFTFSIIWSKKLGSMLQDQHIIITLKHYRKLMNAPL